MLGAPPIPAQPGGKVSERGLGGNRKPNPIGGNGTRSDRRSDRRRRRHPLRPLADRLSAYRPPPHRAVQLALPAPPWPHIPDPPLGSRPPPPRRRPHPRAPSPEHSPPTRTGRQ